MTLQRKAFLIVGVAIATIAVVLATSTSWVLTRQAAALERRQVADALERARAAFGGALEALETPASDYGGWDDTYAFVETLAPGYVESNMTPETFARLRIDHFLLIGASGELRFGRSVDRGALVERPVDPALVARFLAVRAIARPTSAEGRASGVLLVRDRAVLFASSPILTSRGTGPVRGALIMARDLDGKEAERLSRHARLGIEARSAAPDTLPDGLTAAAARLSAGDPVVTRTDGHRSIAGWTLLRDPEGRPAVLLGATIDRSAHVKAHRTVLHVVATVLVVGAALGLLTLLMLRHCVLSRLARLLRQVEAIGAGGAPGRRVQTCGRDEVTRLGASLNGMLASLELAEERRQAALRDSETRYRRLVELSPDAVLLHGEGRILFANGAAARLLDAGEAGAALVGDDLARYLDPELLAEREPGAPREGRVRTRIDRTVQVQAAAVAVEAGATAAHQLVLRDVTATRAFERQLLVADRLSLLGTLAAGVAHEINNPLAFVIGNLGCASNILEAEVLAPADLDELRAALLEAEIGAGRIRDIVRDLRAVSRSGDRLVQASPLREIVDRACRLVRAELRHASRLEVEVDEVPPVLADAAQLGQVLMNLLVNAAQALPVDRGDANRISIRARRGGRGVVLEVEDNGPGMPPEVLARVFDPFFTTKPVGTGTGLGLFVSHGLVAGMGGRLSVESDPGSRTCFRIELPAADEEGARSPARAA